MKVIFHLISLTLDKNGYVVSSVEEYFAQARPRETERCVKRTFDIIDSVAKRFNITNGYMFKQEKNREF